ncbi:MAG: FAD-dependent oxidoreductase, partial [Spirochaetota bacterium]
EEVGVKLDSKGFIETNAQYATTVESIYAIGDCIGAPLLAHVASLEGIKAAEAIAIHDKKEKLHYEPINYDLVPGCTYCHPEVASFGMTEEKAKAAGVKFKIGRFPFSASGRAQALGDASGFIKVIAEEEHGEILGAHIIGTNASEIISELVIAANTELTIHNIAQIIHAHPTLSEGMMEACADVLGEAINI